MNWTAAAIGCGFAILSALIGWLINIVYSLRKEVGEMEVKTMKELEHHSDMVRGLVEKEAMESKLASRRLDVLDRVGSAITDEEFSSKLVAEGDSKIPATRTIRNVVERERVRANGGGSKEV